MFRSVWVADRRILLIFARKRIHSFQPRNKVLILLIWPSVTATRCLTKLGKRSTENRKGQWTCLCFTIQDLQVHFLWPDRCDEIWLWKSLLLYLRRSLVKLKHCFYSNKRYINRAFPPRYDSFIEKLWEKWIVSYRDLRRWQSKWINLCWPSFTRESS